MYERYAGLIFDMDGTILDTEPTHRKAWREVLGHLIWMAPSWIPSLRTVKRGAKY